MLSTPVTSTLDAAAVARLTVIVTASEVLPASIAVTEMLPACALAGMVIVLPLSVALVEPAFRVYAIPSTG